MPDEMMMLFGGAVKTLGNGWIEAPLVRFGDAENHDLVRDYFNADTDFWTQFPAKAAFLYNHGLDDTLKATKLGDGTADLDLRDGDDAGVWMKSQLNMADSYQAAIYQLAEAGKLGTSSGAVSHLVARKAVGDAFLVTSWPIFEASLTPEPCEPRNFGKVTAVKSAGPSFKALLREIEDGEAPAPVKSVYLGANIENSATVAAISRLNDALMYSVLYAALNGDDYCNYGVPGNFSTMTPAERTDYLRSAFDEFRDLSLSIIDAIAAGTGGEAAPDAAKSLKQFYADPSSDDPRVVQMLAGEEMKPFLKTMGAVVKETARRLSWYDDQRGTKQGRPISAENLATMQEVCAGMQGHVDTLKAMVEKHTTAEADKKKRPSLDAVYMDFLYAQTHGGAISL